MICFRGIVDEWVPHVRYSSYSYLTKRHQRISTFVARRAGK